MPPKVVVLAAGKSTRMWPLREKVLFPMLGKTILQHQIEMLQSCGTQEICVVGHPGNIEQYRDELSGQDCDFAVQEDGNGIRGGLQAARQWIGDDPFVVVNSNDIVEKKCFENIFSAVENYPAEILIVGKTVENYFPGGYLCVEGDKISNIIEKPTPGTQPSNLVNLLIHYHQDPNRLFTALEQVTKGDEYEEGGLQALFDAGVNAQVVEYSGFWQAIKYPWHLLDIMQKFLGNIEKPSIDPTAQISETAVIEGNVTIGANTKIGDFTKIVGPCVIGDNCIIGDQNLIRHSQIGDDCVIGRSEVARSYVHNGCQLHQNYIGDSVLDQTVFCGAGFTTANYKLDGSQIASEVKQERVSTERVKFGSTIGQNTHIGVQSCTMPGVKIGQDCQLGSQMNFSTDIEDQKFVVEKHSYQVLPNQKVDKK